MNPRTRPAILQHYENFDPRADSVAAQDAITFLVHLPGFKKNELRVEFLPSRVVRISGEHSNGDEKRKRFVKEIRIPDEYDANRIKVKLDDGILYVMIPKLVTQESNHPSSIVNNSEKEDMRKNGEKEVDGSKFKHEMESGDVGNADLSKKNELQEIRSHEEGIFDKIKNNSGMLLLILVLAVAVALKYTTK